MALQDVPFLWPGARLSETVQVRLRKHSLSDREGVTIPSSCPVTTHLWYLVLAVCLPHAYLLPKP